MTSFRKTKPTPAAVRRPGAATTRTTATTPRNKARDEYRTFSELRVKMRARVLDGRMGADELALLQALNNLPPSMPLATRSAGTTEAAYHKVWDRFAAQVNELVPQLERLAARAGIRRA